MQTEYNGAVQVLRIAKGDAYHKPSNTVVTWRVPIGMAGMAYMKSANENDGFLPQVDELLMHIDRLGMDRGAMYVGALNTLCQKHINTKSV